MNTRIPWLVWLGLPAAAPARAGQQDRGQGQETGQPAADPDPLPRALKDLWDAARAGAVWRSPRVAEREALQEAIGEITRDAGSCTDATLQRARAAMSRADLALDVLEPAGPGGPRIAVVREGTERRGAGLYAVRCGEARPWVWQAPHSLHDEGTGRLVRQVFAESGARAAMWNTVHRHKALPGEQPDDPIHPADVTREPGSLFHAATVAMAVADPALRFIQVHGFARTELEFDAVLSSGATVEQPVALADALAPLLGRVAAWGRDTSELGATLNVQGQMLAKWPGRRFLHLELSPDLRGRLSQERELRAALISALAEAEW